MSSNVSKSINGNDILNEIEKEEIENKRHMYKQAIKYAYYKHKEAEDMVVSKQDLAKQAKTKLDALVEGGMEGYFASNDSLEKSSFSKYQSEMFLNYKNSK
jgi:hypothetical protein